MSLRDRGHSSHVIRGLKPTATIECRSAAKAERDSLTPASNVGCVESSERTANGRFVVPGSGVQISKLAGGEPFNFLVAITANFEISTPDPLFSNAPRSWASCRFRCVPKTPRTLRDGSPELACQTRVCVFFSLNSIISGRVAGGKPFAAGESGNPQAQTDVALVKTRWRLVGVGLPLVETRSHL